MMIKHIYLTVIFCVLIANSVAGHSSESVKQRELTWQQAVDYVLSQNPTLQSGKMDVETAAFREKVEKAAFLPQVSANISHSRQEDIRGEGNSSLSDGSYSAGLSVSQSLFQGGESSARLDQAKFLSESQRQQLEQTRVELSYQLKRRFQNLIFAQQLEGLAAEIVERRRDNVNLIELRYESGQEDRGSLLLSQANFEQSRFELTQAKDLVRNTEIQLLELLGLDEHTPLIMSDEVPVSLPPLADELNFQDLATEVPAYQRSFYSKQAAEKGVRVANSSHFPSLSLNADLNSQGQEFFPDDTGRFNVGLTLNIPIFSGGRDYYRSQIAVNDWVVANKNHREQYLEIISNLEDRYTQYTQAVKRVEVERKFREAAELRAEIARTKYSNGLLSFEEWDRIENDFISREQSYLRTLRDRVFAQAEWERARGYSVFD